MCSLWGKDSVNRIRCSKMKALENVKESKILGTSLVVQWLRLRASNAEGMG